MRKSNDYLRITGLLIAGAKEEAQSLIESLRCTMNELEYQECLGNIHFYSEEYQQAIPFYEAAIQSPGEYDCARYHYLIGIQAEQAGKLSDAFQRYQAAIEIEPEFVDAYIELGGLLCKVEDFEGALQCYNDAIVVDPSDASIRHNLVEVLSKLAEKDSARYSELLRNARVEFGAMKMKVPNATDKRRVW